MQVLKKAGAITAVLAGLALSIGLGLEAFADAPPVRIAVVPGGGSGMEQDVVDRISNELGSNPNVKVSTVNPDWFVQCNIFDRNDTAGGSVRVNGTVVIKTVDGHVLNTVSMQTNKQDFSLTPGFPVNKALAMKGVTEVISGLVDRARQPLADAVEIEMQTREKLMTAQSLGDEDKYAEGLRVLMSVTQDSPHFSGARKMMEEFQMEQDAMDMVKEAESFAKQGKYRQALELLKAVSPKSKRAGLAKALSGKYRSILAGKRPTARPAKAQSSTKPDADAQLKALEAQKKALDAQKRAVEAQEAALKKAH
ncbi:MAG: hypothetical protein K2X27_19750 [Candidatus Obscuribacterales bacterium]|nr:hypothetical protein [Candidatus Obscuribacterales bacterium]